jgi:hypothetical protein
MAVITVAQAGSVEFRMRVTAHHERAAPLPVTEAHGSSEAASVPQPTQGDTAR